jgi:hypothetical protein
MSTERTNDAYWHIAAFAALQRQRSLSDQQRTKVGIGAELLGRE